MRNLSDPDTELAGFFQGLGRAAGEVAPVASTNAELFGNMADTFAAITRTPEAVQDSITEGVPTQIQAIRSFRFQLPFLRDFADLSRRLRPAARQLPRSLPQINRALLVGRDVLPRTVELSNRLRGTFNALDDLGENPNTLLAINDLDLLVRAGKPGLDYVDALPDRLQLRGLLPQPARHPHLDPDRWRHAPARAAQVRQPRAAQQPDPAERLAPGRRRAGPEQQAARRPTRRRPCTATPTPRPSTPTATPTARSARPATSTASSPNSRYGPNELGGRKVALGSDLPGLRGGTYKSRQLGIDNLNDVP